MASGDTFAGWTAQGYFMPATNFARISKSLVTLVPCVKFDDTADQTAFFEGVMPGQYDGTSGLTVTLIWKFETFVGAQTVDWEVSFARLEDAGADIDTVVFATAETALGTEPGTTGFLDYHTDTFASGTGGVGTDDVQPGDLFIIRVTRDASGGTQGGPGDAELYAVVVTQT